MTADAMLERRMELLTVKEFADVARVHPLSVYRLIREGRQRGVCRIGREIRIDISIALRPDVIQTYTGV